jgi:hypothetical protein
VVAPLGTVDTEIDWMAERDHIGISSTFDVSFVPWLLGWEWMR